MGLVKDLLECRALGFSWVLARLTCETWNVLDRWTGRSLLPRKRLEVVEAHRNHLRHGHWPLTEMKEPTFYKLICATTKAKKV